MKGFKLLHSISGIPHKLENVNSEAAANIGKNNAEIQKWIFLFFTKTSKFYCSVTLNKCSTCVLYKILREILYRVKSVFFNSSRTEIKSLNLWKSFQSLG